MTTPEEAQRVTDLRVRMLENVRNGRPAHEGISLEELQQGLAHISAPRVSAAAAGAKAKAKKAATPKPLNSANLSDKTKAMLALLEGDV